MDWERFYRERPATLERLINDIWDHKEFLIEITSSGHNILEVGTGTGILSIFLSHLGYNVVSIDNNHSVLEMARVNSAHLKGRPTFAQADASNLPFGDDSFDTCFSQGIFEHFTDSDIREFLKESLRVAKTVLFSVPTYWYPRQDFGDERLMKKEDWLRILAGVKVAKAVYYSGRKGSKAKPSQLYFEVVRGKEES